MRYLVLITVVLAIAAARPEMYREKEDFQYSRSSSDEGSKSGYYGAQRGNMGGNYEKAHNMDSLAQHQMSGLIHQVDGELGEGSNTKSGSVFTAANSRGMYGSGHYDTSNLEGRNFQEGTSFGNSHSQSALTNSAYRDQTSRENRYSNSNSYSHSSRHSNSEQSEYEQREGVQSSNLRSGDRSYQQEYGTYDGSSRLTHSTSPYQNRLVSTRPMRILLRPGTRTTIPIATQTYDAEHSASSYDASEYNKNAAKSDAELITHNAHSSSVNNVPENKHYESSYSYHKEWEKHHSNPGVAPLGIDTDRSLPKTSELYDDSQQTQAYNSRNQQYTSNAAGSHHNHHSSNSYGYNTKSNSASSSHSRQQSEYDIQRENLSSALNSIVGNGHQSNYDADYVNQQGTTNSKPKSYQSSYSYHKSWERQGDPYVIVPVPGGQNGQESQRLIAASNTHNGYSSHQYGANHKQSHQSYSSSNGLMDCDCDEEGHVRVARSYNSDQELQQQNGWEDFGQHSQNQWDTQSQDLGQQSQNQWDKIEDLGQHSQNQWDTQSQDLGQQSQNQWDKIEDLGQHSQNQWDTRSQDLGQQSQNQWDKIEDLGQHSQNQWDTQSQDLGQQSQNQWDKIEDLGQHSQNQWDTQSQDLGQQSQNQWDKIEDLGQHSQNQWDTQSQDLGQQSQNQWDKIEDLGQHSQNQWDKIEDLGQHSQNQWDTQSQDLGQQSQNQWDKIEDLGQQSQNQWDKIEDLGQHSQNQWDTQSQDLGQQSQNQWDKIEDLGQHSYNDRGKPDSFDQQSQSNVNQEQTKRNKLKKSHKQSNTNNHESQDADDLFKPLDDQSLFNPNINTFSEVETHYTDNGLDKEETVHDHKYLHQHVPDQTRNNERDQHASINNLWDRLDSLDKESSLNFNTHNYHAENNIYIPFSQKVTTATDVSSETPDKTKSHPKDFGRGDIETENSEFETSISNTERTNFYLNADSNLNNKNIHRAIQIEGSSLSSNNQANTTRGNSAQQTNNNSMESIPQQIEEINDKKIIKPKINKINEKRITQNNDDLISKKVTSDLHSINQLESKDNINQIKLQDLSAPDESFDKSNQRDLEQHSMAQDDQNYASFVQYDSNHYFEKLGAFSENYGQHNVNQNFDNIYPQIENLDQQIVYEDNSGHSSDNQKSLKDDFKNKKKNRRIMAQDGHSFDMVGEEFDHAQSKDNFMDVSTINENFDHQSVNQQYETFDQQHENLDQHEIEQNLQNFDQSNDNFDQENLNQNLYGTSKLYETFDQQKENPYNDKGHSNDEVSFYIQNFGKPDQQKSKPNEINNKLDENVEPPREIFVQQNFDHTGHERDTSVIEKNRQEYSDQSISLNDLQENKEIYNPLSALGEQNIVTTTITPEPEQIGFWASVGKKINKAKDKVTSWFRKTPEK
ncbi:putative uncharacterized protein DDB_G0282133 [Amyelois transitella]|uniref:putative uncharacterized protein DDB_G0282133 n=1 Tax=Amyelois transitella TaxID=680683 RepID=UPI0029903331|nr:putative uncharacterized protein DDB_G0282133 [Amyelois transitella]XP_013192457.2 putative uncharacterized protein DDB_G0282133 [Amyelois transitella]